MLKYDHEKHSFQPVKETDLKQAKVLERIDLQKTIINSWEAFRKEIGIPSSYLIGSEIRPHESTQDSLDLLAFDPDESQLIVIELKRNKSKLQLLQALSYAAMVSKWDSERLVNEIQREINPEPDELIEIINGTEISSDIRVFLISEYYDPEVIITTDWLNSNYNVDITAFSIKMQAFDKNWFLDVEQRYPLKELKDAYEARTRRIKNAGTTTSLTWEDVLPSLKYKFAQEAIKICLKYSPGDVSRRRFGRIRSKYDGFTWISLNFRRKYINVYLKGNFEDAKNLIQSKFRSNLEINTWRDGFSFFVDQQEQFEDLIKWLKL